MKSMAHGILQSQGNLGSLLADAGNQVVLYSLKGGSVFAG
jgi:hypothetical protein